MWEEWEDFITGGVDGDNASVLPTWNPTNTTIGSLWDYLGFPTGIVPTGALPIDFVRRAYNRIYNEYYRDENLITEVAETSEIILNRCWEKDYFASALPWQQRGTAPALPISGTTSAVFPGSTAGIATSGYSAWKYSSTQPNYLFSPDADSIRGVLNNNTVNLASATTFNVSDLRLAFQIQKWMERNARAGAGIVTGKQIGRAHV